MASRTFSPARLEAKLTTKWSSYFFTTPYYHVGVRDNKDLSNIQPRLVNESTQRFRHIHFKHITARATHYAAAFLSGLPEMPIDDASFSELSLSMSPNASAGLPDMLGDSESMCCPARHPVAATGGVGLKLGAGVATSTQQGRARQSARPQIRYPTFHARAGRVLDPYVKTRGRWIARRLSPDCSRIELFSLPQGHDELHLLRAMGAKTANVHLGSQDAVKAVRKHLEKDSSNWLPSAAKAILKTTTDDWKEWQQVTITESDFQSSIGTKLSGQRVEDSQCACNCYRTRLLPYDI